MVLLKRIRKTISALTGCWQKIEFKQVSKQALSKYLSKLDYGKGRVALMDAVGFWKLQYDEDSKYPFARRRINGAKKSFGGGDLKNFCGELSLKIKRKIRLTVNFGGGLYLFAHVWGELRLT